MTVTDSRRGAAALVFVAALGYFVDIYDLILFSVVRVASLRDLGFAGDRLLTAGAFLLNVQMVGMLLGGFLWGVLGDKKGRLSVLFGSIILYSLANAANAFVHGLTSYAFCRFAAGLGLAGELGAGVTLVAETLPVHLRGWGTMLVASIGVLGAVAAVMVGDVMSWRASYVTGGVLGLTLLLLRVSVRESGIFRRAESASAPRGRLSTLFSTPRNALKYAACVGMGLPCWYVVGVLVTFAPEFGRALGMPQPPAAGHAVMQCYLGLALGDFASGSLSQLAKSRRKVIASFLVLTAVAISFYLGHETPSPAVFDAACLFLGFSVGYWAVLVTTAAEQFGTNIRSTVATTVPNMVRGMLVPISLAFAALRPSLGLRGAAAAVGAVCVAGALLSVAYLEETHHKDLDYLEG